MSNFQSVQKYYSYNEFLQLMEVLVAGGKTSGATQSADLIFYTKLNLQRMQRIDKTATLDEAIAAKATTAAPQVWWVINEAWCGDAAQTIPFMRKVAAASAGNIELRIIMRDEHPDIMDRYLTNGARSIPRLIAEDKQGKELFAWGPRPAFAQQLIMAWKADNNSKTLNDIERDLHAWYAKDKGKSLQQELLLLMHK